MPLSMASKGVPICIQQVGGKAETKRFLESLGFVCGATVTIINSLDGDLIVRVKDARIAISQSMANKIHVA